jgi:hypothetical protein
MGEHLTSKTPEFKSQCCQKKKKKSGQSENETRMYFYEACVQ